MLARVGPPARDILAKKRYGTPRVASTRLSAWALAPSWLKSTGNHERREAGTTLFVRGKIRRFSWDIGILGDVFVAL